MAGHETSPKSNPTYWKVYVKKWDGSSETAIANSTESKRLEPVHLEIDSDVCIVPIECSLTHFKRGETLRITLEGWVDGVGIAHAGQIALLHDPANRLPAIGTDYDYNGGAVAITTAPDTSQLIFHVPFRLEV